MNWLDWLLTALLALAAFKGFQRGFIVELSSLVAFILGIWIAVQASDRVGSILGIAAEQSALAFLLTFVLVLVAVLLRARGRTTLIDLAQLGLANKLAGSVFGVLRSAFTLSILLNLLAAWSDGTMPSREAREGSTLYGPVQAFAPFILPPLGGTKWVEQAVEQFKQEAKGLWEGEP